MEPKRHLTSDQARRHAEQAARILARDARVKLVYLFGSAAQGDRPSVRDVDIAVLTDTPMTGDDLTRLRADLVLATVAPIDLIPLNDAPIVPTREVADTGVGLFARSDDVETEFVTRARARCWDFKPFLEEQWRLAGERLEERRHGP